VGAEGPGWRSPEVSEGVRLLINVLSPLHRAPALNNSEEEEEEEEEEEGGKREREKAVPRLSPSWDLIQEAARLDPSDRRESSEQNKERVQK